MAIVLTLIAVVAAWFCIISQMGVKIVFFIVIYMTKFICSHPYFDSPTKHICRLPCSSYALNRLLMHGFNTLYLWYEILVFQLVTMILLCLFIYLYVDVLCFFYMLIMRNDMEHIFHQTKQLGEQFQMFHLGSQVIS